MGAGRARSGHHRPREPRRRAPSSCRDVPKAALTNGGRRSIARHAADPAAASYSSNLRAVPVVTAIPGTRQIPSEPQISDHLGITSPVRDCRSCGCRSRCARRRRRRRRSRPARRQPPPAGTPEAPGRRGRAGELTGCRRGGGRRGGLTDEGKDQAGGCEAACARRQSGRAPPDPPNHGDDPKEAGGRQREDAVGSASAATNRDATVATAPCSSGPPSTWNANGTLANHSCAYIAGLPVLPTSRQPSPAG